MVAACAIGLLAGVGIVLSARLSMRKRRLPVTVTVDENDPRPVDVAHYLAEIAERLDERPERMRVVFNAPSGLELDLERDGSMTVALPGRRTCRFDLRRRWIADHPVPFSIGPCPRGFLRLRRRAVLYIDPVDANRFRVSDRSPLMRW